MTRDWFVLLLLTIAFSRAAWAGEVPPPAPDVAIEARAVALETELRCLVCQNQTLADSNAPLAVDLRQQIREKLRQGASDRDIIEFMVARYGEFVLYRPPFKATTALLWAGPLVLLIAGFAALTLRLRRRPEQKAAISAEERARAAAMLAGDKGPEPK